MEEPIKDQTPTAAISGTHSLIESTYLCISSVFWVVYDDNYNLFGCWFCFFQGTLRNPSFKDTRFVLPLNSRKTSQTHPIALILLNLKGIFLHFVVVLDFIIQSTMFRIAMALSILFPFSFYVQQSMMRECWKCFKKEQEYSVLDLFQLLSLEFVGK